MASATFPKALAFTLCFEGLWSDDPRDPGGATMRGVTLATFRQFYPGATATQLRNAPMLAFETIYRKGYWAKINADALPAGVDLLAFDIAVNMGPARVLPWLAETAKLSPVARIHAIDARRLGFWRALRTFPVFGKGWLRRENACLKAALALAESTAHTAPDGTRI